MQDNKYPEWQAAIRAAQAEALRKEREYDAKIEAERAQQEAERKQRQAQDMNVFLKLMCIPGESTDGTFTIDTYRFSNINLHRVQPPKPKSVFLSLPEEKRKEIERINAQKLAKHEAWLASQPLEETITGVDIIIDWQEGGVFQDAVEWDTDHNYDCWQPYTINWRRANGAHKRNTIESLMVDVSHRMDMLQVRRDTLIERYETYIKQDAGAALKPEAEFEAPTAAERLVELLREIAREEHGWEF